MRGREGGRVRAWEGMGSKVRGRGERGRCVFSFVTSNGQLNCSCQ